MASTYQAIKEPAFIENRETHYALINQGEISIYKELKHANYRLMLAESGPYCYFCANNQECVLVVLHVEDEEILQTVLYPTNLCELRFYPVCYSCASNEWIINRLALCIFKTKVWDYETYEIHERNTNSYL